MCCRTADIPLEGHDGLTLTSGIQKPSLNPGGEYQDIPTFQSSRTDLNFERNSDYSNERPMSESSPDGSPQLIGPLLPNQKIRTTCNACQQAKIRCSHASPCSRCESHGFKCVYSISQPLGRPAKKKGGRPTTGLQLGRTQAEGKSRPLGRGAPNGPKIVTAARPVTARTRQGIPRQRGTPKSSPEARGGSSSGTEVTGEKADLGVPGAESVEETSGKRKASPNGQPLPRLDSLIDDHRTSQKHRHLRPEIRPRASKVLMWTRPSVQERKNKTWTQTTRSQIGIGRNDSIFRSIPIPHKWTILFSQNLVLPLSV